MYKYASLLKIIFLSVLCAHISICVAKPPNDGTQGKLIFLGVNNSSSQSVWLSVTNTAGSFQLQTQGQQIVDAWEESAAGLRLSLSPFVSSGNGGTHQLINASNDKKLDSENQQGGVVFPPFPSVPPIGGHPEHPIVIPPGSPSHPIVIPPGSPSHPIVIPPGSPSHPIVIPPGSPEHPIVIPPNSPEYPIEIPPGSTLPEQGSGVTGTTSDSAQNKNTFYQEAPITEARQFDEEEKWNIWSDNYYYQSKDSQYNMDAKGITTNFIVGADRHITNNLVGGGMLSSLNYDTTAFSGTLDNNVKGFNIGPYFGYQISPQWSTDGVLTYGQLRNNNRISSLNSHYLTRSASGTLHATGLFQLGKFQLKPQPLISYTHFQNPTYQFYGNIGNIPVEITREEESFNFGYTEFKVEGNYSIEKKNGDIIQPYTEVGVDYAFVRPTDGQIYSGNLALASYSPLSELLTLGVRALISKKLLIQTSASYLSFGQNNLDVWNVRLLASYSF